jgi:hypothetical protein
MPLYHNSIKVGIHLPFHYLCIFSLAARLPSFLPIRIAVYLEFLSVQSVREMIAFQFLKLPYYLNGKIDKVRLPQGTRDR